MYRYWFWLCVGIGIDTGIEASIVESMTIEQLLVVADGNAAN